MVPFLSITAIEPSLSSNTASRRSTRYSRQTTRANFWGFNSRRRWVAPDGRHHTPVRTAVEAHKKRNLRHDDLPSLLRPEISACPDRRVESGIRTVELPDRAACRRPGPYLRPGIASRSPLLYAALCHQPSAELPSVLLKQFPRLNL